MISLMSTLRRIEWMTWLPPIDSASPSPVMTQTMRSGPGRLEPGGERRRAAVDGVEAERVHVVRQPARAADARDEDDVLLRVAEVGHHLLGLGEDRVVAAAGAPADLLVGHEVLAGQLDDGRVLGAQRRLGRTRRRGRWSRSVMRRSPRGSARLRPRSRRSGTACPDPVVADGVDQVARPEEQQQLAEVDLRDEDPPVAAQDVLGVARERVEVAQVGVGDATGRRPAGARRPSGWRRRWSPSRG